MQKKERPMYVPPSRRAEQSRPTSSQSPTSKPRLEVKLSKKENIVHAWEKEEIKTDNIVHAWQKDNPSVFKLPSKPFKAKNDQSMKNGKIHAKSQKQKPADSILSETSSQQTQSASVTFVNAKDYLAEISTADWNDLDEIDYSKVPKWNH